MTQKIETKKAFITLLPPNIILLEFKPDVIFELENAIEVNTKIYELINGKSFFSLIDISNRYGTITSEAQKHFVDDPLTKNIRLAEAFIVTNLPMRILARFYKSFYKPNNPIKFFKNKEKAFEWFNQLKKNT